MIDDRWAYVCELDEELLKGGAVMSEWCAMIVREADLAFVGEAHLATVITAMAGIETHLRSESEADRRVTSFDLIEQSDFTTEVKAELHELRRYRNQWVHISNPWNDEELLGNPQLYEDELEKMALRAIRLLRKVVYSNPMI